MSLNQLKPVEQRIIKKLVKRATDSYLVSVFDGEEYPVKFESDPDKVLKEMVATDIERLVIRDTSKVRIGSVLLVYGEGEDVLADYSWSEKYPGSEELMAQLCR